MISESNTKNNTNNIIRDIIYKSLTNQKLTVNNIISINNLDTSAQWYLDYNNTKSYKKRMSIALGLTNITEEEINKYYITLNITYNNITKTLTGATHVLTEDDQARITEIIKTKIIGQCICGHPIERLFLIYCIKNTLTSNAGSVFIVGSKCIQKFKLSKVCSVCQKSFNHRKITNKEEYNTICKECKINNDKQIEVIRNQRIILHNNISTEYTMGFKNPLIYKPVSRFVEYHNIRNRGKINIYDYNLPQIKSKYDPKMEKTIELRQPYFLIQILRDNDPKYKNIINTIVWSLNNRPDIRRHCRTHIKMIKYLSNNQKIIISDIPLYKPIIY